MLIKVVNIYVFSKAISLSLGSNNNLVKPSGYKSNTNKSNQLNTNKITNKGRNTYI